MAACCEQWRRGWVSLVVLRELGNASTLHRGQGSLGSLIIGRGNLGRLVRFWGVSSFTDHWTRRYQSDSLCQLKIGGLEDTVGRCQCFRLELGGCATSW